MTIVHKRLPGIYIATNTLLLLGLTLFFIRGVWRALNHSGDFAPPYSSTRAWIQGINPYDYENIVKVWREGGGDPKVTPDTRTTPSVYPPTTFVCLSPVALLPWPLARATWMLASVGILVVMLYSMIRGARSTISAPRALAFVGLVLALSPVSTGVNQGNPSIMAVSCVLLSLVTASKRLTLTAAFLLALSIGIKPQIGAPFLLFHLLLRRWRLGFIAICIVGIISFIAITRLNHIGYMWLQDWIYNIQRTTATGGINDISDANPQRTDALNLETLTYGITGSVSYAKAGAAVLVLITGCFYLYLFFGIDKQKEEWLAASAFAILALLPIYHRFYDASLLVAPLYWYLFSESVKMRRDPKLLLALLPFFFPVVVLLRGFAAAGSLPFSLATKWWWNALVMTHQVIILVLVCSYLFYKMSQASKSGAEVCEDRSV